MTKLIKIFSLFISDKDECKAGGACSGGDCINTEGGFECLCPDGRSLSEDGASCVGRFLIEKKNNMQL